MLAGEISSEEYCHGPGGYWHLGGPPRAKNEIITNNTLLNCKRNAILLGEQGGGDNTNATITNNIIVNSGNAGSVGGYGIVANSGGCSTTIFLV